MQAIFPAVTGVPRSVPGGGGGDPYWDNVYILLGMDGADGSTSFVNESQYDIPFSRVSSPTITTSTAKFGGSSGNFQRTGYITAAHPDFAPGTGDFTLEGFLNWSTSGAEQYGFVQAFTPSASVVPSTNNIAIFSNNDYALYNFGNIVIHAGPPIVLHTWEHFAITQTWTGPSAVLRFFIAGALIHSAANTHNITAQGMNFGGYYSVGYYGNGYMDEIRYTKGVSRYTADFTPPTEAFPRIGL